MTTATSTDSTYNGWTNYATWRVNLEICDDLISHLSNDIEDGYVEPFNDESEFADHLSAEVEQIVTGYGELDTPAAALALSYADAFVSDVNYYEIAQHAREDYPHMFAEDSDN